MADITITIPDGSLTRIVNALCARYGYQETINGQANPETKNQFVKRMIIERIKNDVSLQEAETQQDALRAIVRGEINNISIT